MKKITVVLAVCLCLCCITAVGCSQTEREDSGRFVVVCSIFPQYDFCRIISGGLDEVILLQANGVDMHSYEATSRDIVTVSRADMLIYTGGGSDTWVEGMLRSAQNDNIVTASLFDWASVLPTGEHEHEHDHSHAEGEVCSAYDEHVWTSPKNAKKIVLGMCEAMCEANPKNADAYRENTEKYIKELETLDREYEDFFDSVKPTLIIADRFPFAYLKHDYGIECHSAFAGCSSETGASFEVVVSLINEVKASGVDAVFEVDSSNSDVANRISESCRVEKRSLYSCQSVTRKQLDNGESYLSFMKKNLETLREAYDVNI